MHAKKKNFVLGAMVLGLVAGVSLAGCGSDGTDANGEQTETESTETPQPTETESTETSLPAADTAQFDGTWRANCFKTTVFGVPEENQPDGYNQSTLTIDDGAKTYSLNQQFYTDSECITEDPSKAANLNSGDIRFDGLTTTSTGLEATVVRYLNNADAPDLNGLLYRGNDVLYRDLRLSTVIEDDKVPSELALSNPWQLVE